MRKLIFSLILSAAAFAANPLFAMEEIPDDDTEMPVSYISPSALGLLDVIMIDPPHTCAYCNVNLRFKDADKDIYKEPLGILQSELIIEVLKKFSIEDILIYSNTSKAMYNLCQSPVLWEEIANRETIWQPQEHIEISGWREKLSETTLKQSILNHQKPIKGTAWILNSIALDEIEWKTILEKKMPPKWCIKDQILSDHLYYSNLFDTSAADQSNGYFASCWVKASQLRSFLEKPCTITWNPLGENQPNQQTYCFPIGKNKFEVYVYQKNKVVNIKEDIYFSSSQSEDQEIVFVSPDANISIKKLDQEKK